MIDIPSQAAPDLPAQTGTADLIGYGRITWDQLATILGGAQAAWADYSGFHIGPLPSTPPPYSHLWAWTGQWLARVRIDNGTAIAGILALDGEPHPALPIRSRESVHFQRVKAGTWPRNERRVGPLPGGVADRTMDMYLIPGHHPITFVAAPSTPAGEDPR